MLIIHNETLLGLLRHSYRRDEVERLIALLEERGTFRFHSLANGLFPAAASAADHDDSGYQYVWVRDNVHIAHAHYVWGEAGKAARTARSLMAFFQGQRGRMRQVIARPALAADPMQRPHVRFDGRGLAELGQRWPHAQNDALGYFLWFYSKLAREALVPCGEAERQCLTELVRYLGAIQYWADQDSGHWEEARKVSASSIGAVVAGLREFSAMSHEAAFWPAASEQTGGVDGAGGAELLGRGEAALKAILPYESRGGGSSGLSRRYDAALLFLIYPLRVLPPEVAAPILSEVTANLEGDLGVRRYLGDSYWCADYHSLYSSKERTGDFSESVQERDAHVRPGEEAQWCIFDPIISCIHGMRLAEWQQESARALQSHYLNRSLGQLTEDTLLCPEAYFLEQGRYIPNDHTPLQWTQANLRMALHWLHRTAL